METLYRVLSVLLLMLLLIIVIVGLCKKHGGGIRVVWGFFSFFFVVTSVALFWAFSSGVFTELGATTNGQGEFLLKIFDVMTDIELDLKIFLAVFVIMVLPQLLCYVLSGLSGNAWNLFFIKESWAFLVWSTIKAFATCAGVFFSVAMVGMYYIHDWREGKGLGLIFMSLSAQIIAFVILYVYRESETVIDWFRQKLPSWFIRHLSCLHKCFTRHEE